MSKYLKSFDTHTDYETYKNGQDFITPNVSYCGDANDVHYNPYVDPYNGHDYVDLGLPSGTIWATKNIGASTITDYGLFFSWGSTQGYTSSQVGSGEGKKYFGYADYELGDGQNGGHMTKYNSTDGKTILDATDDIATVNMGGEWHMPNREQIQELFNTTYVTNSWATNYQGSGISGKLFTSVADNTKTLFFPATGYAMNGSVSNISNGGSIWSRTIYGSNLANAYRMNFMPDVGTTNNTGRYLGLMVRGVVGEIS